ncbi:hypothetical protein G6F59_015370 [Rhizopus arrhizus]|nr:hypothetical protein G6F59_015370 [Rhizopus arrhizus]
MGAARPRKLLTGIDTTIADTGPPPGRVRPDSGISPPDDHPDPRSAQGFDGARAVARAVSRTSIDMRPLRHRPVPFHRAGRPGSADTDGARAARQRCRRRGRP